MKNFVVYKSSAGSGKTFTLVREYLRLALADEKRIGFQFRRILAITFTNKAAAEMKARVLEALRDMVDKDEPGHMARALMDSLHVDYKNLRERSRKLLKAILHHYADFAISTIDSFTHKIVKTFSHDLKLPVNFNVETDVGGFYQKVISRLLATIGEDEYVSRLLKNYALEKAEVSESWDPERQITEFAKLLERENSGDYIRLLKQFSAEELDAFRVQFREFIQHYQETVRSICANAVSMIQSKGLLPDDFKYKKSSGVNAFYKGVQGPLVVADVSGARFQSAMNEQSWLAKSNTEVDSALTEMASQLYEFVSSNGKYFGLCRILIRQMYPLMLLKKIEELTQDAKQEERLVFISEFNERIHDIIQNEPAPFIYERLGERYSHFLIDEFQDTSSMQWLNILPLVDNSLSAGWYNLIVGDGKQSIYRWRNANVRQFAMLPSLENPGQHALMTERANTLARHYQGSKLDTNYRSLRHVVDFNNAFFDHLRQQLPGEIIGSIYEQHTQLPVNQQGGLVTLHSGPVDSVDLDASVLNLVLLHLEQAVNDGFEARDVCVLVRTNRHGSSVASFLTDRGHKVVSSDSLLLQNSTEVNVIVAFLNVLSNPSDHVNAAVVVNYLLLDGRMTDEVYHTALRSLPEKGLLNVLSEQGIDLNEGNLTFNNLLDNVMLIARALDLTKHGDAYVRFFIDEVNSFMMIHDGSLPEFLQWWEGRSRNASLVVPDSTNAVRIMTIHASKGLEFPVVIIPYCNWKIERPSESWVKIHDERAGLPVGVVALTNQSSESGFVEEYNLEVEEQTLDSLNLLYVAFTRAVERLHIITLKGSRNFGRTVADWVDGYFATLPGGKEGHWSIGEKKSKAHPSHKKGPQAMDLEPLTFSTDAQAIKIKTGTMVDDEGEAARREGVLLHKALSVVRFMEDIPEVVNSCVIRGLITEEQRSEYESKLRKIIDQPSILPFFSPPAEIRNEAEILFSDGDIVRPDRVVQLGAETIVIDYKSGKKKTSHAEQLRIYSRALEELGFSSVRKLLVYVDPPDIVEVN